MEPDSACGRNWMLPIWRVCDKYVIAIHADKPIHSANETHQKKIEWRNAAFLGELGMKANGNELRDNGTKAQ